MKPGGSFSEFNNKICFSAVQDVVQNLPGGSADFHEAIRAYADSIYSKLCRNNESFFLDKTPRYYLIINEIAEIFPDAKFIFLFRHPLSIFSSIIETFNKGRIGTYWNKIDLYKGPVELSKGYQLIKEKSIGIKYEDLIRSPEKSLRALCAYLQISYQHSMIDNFNTIALKGRMGDPTGVVDYNSLATAPLDKWKKAFNSRYRKQYAKKYIQGFNEATFTLMGYAPTEIIREIEAIEPVISSSFNDRLSVLFANIRSLFEIPFFKIKIKKLINDKKDFFLHF